MLGDHNSECQAAAELGEEMQTSSTRVIRSHDSEQPYSRKSSSDQTISVLSFLVNILFEDCNGRSKPRLDQHRRLERTDPGLNLF